MTAPLLLIAVALLQATEVTESNTQVKFPVELQVATGVQALTGTGVRTRTIAKVKVYAFGLYVEQTGARSALAAWRGKKAAGLSKGPAF